MKSILTILFLFSLAFSNANEKLILKTEKGTKSFQFMISPFLFYNSCHLGFNLNITDNLENSFSIGTELMNLSTSLRFTLNISNTVNFNLNNNQFYIPLLLRVKNNRHVLGYEEGYFPHKLRFTLGSGIGKKITFNDKVGVRIDAIAGASINLTSSKGKVFPNKFYFSEYSFDKLYPQQNPKIIPAIRLRVGFYRNF